MIPPPTERLRFREMTEADLDPMAGLLGDPEVMRCYPRPKTAPATICPMDIRRAGPDDVGAVAQLLWQHASSEEQKTQPADRFAVDLARWCADHEDSHHAFVAAHEDAGIVGMAWLALLPRVPRPGTTNRRSGDIQSVFVIPEHRGRGIGTRLVGAATEHAFALGAGRVTVSSGRRAVPVYERLGFSSSSRLLEKLADRSLS